jgi:cytochrome b
MKTESFLIWDLPIRIFHWLLTAGFIAAALIAFLAEGESSLFPYHAIIGLVLVLMVLLRVIWGFIGTPYARFASFLFGPRAVMDYLKGAVLGGGTRHIGHNPGSAYAIFAMLAMVLGISVTGIKLSLGNEDFKDAHEVLSYAMIALVVAHVLGVILHSVRHHENIILSMVNGKKNCESSIGIASARPIAAGVFLGLLGLWTLGLVANYNATAKSTKIPLLGVSLQLGENEKGEKQGKRPGASERKHDND